MTSLRTNALMAACRHRAAPHRPRPGPVHAGQHPHDRAGIRPPERRQAHSRCAVGVLPRAHAGGLVDQPRHRRHRHVAPHLRQFPVAPDLRLCRPRGHLHQRGQRYRECAILFRGTAMSASSCPAPSGSRAAPGPEGWCCLGQPWLPRRLRRRPQRYRRQQRQRHDHLHQQPRPLQRTHRSQPGRAGQRPTAPGRRRPQGATRLAPCGSGTAAARSSPPSGARCAWASTAIPIMA